METNLNVDTFGSNLKIRQTIGYFAALIVIGLSIATLGPTIPYLADNTASSLNRISVLFSARSLGYLLGSLGIGRLYDRLAGHRLIASLLLVLGVTMALTPLISFLWLLVVVLLLLGISEGGADVGSNTLLIWVHGRKVGPYMNGLHFFFGFGAFLAPIIIAQTLLMTGDIQFGYWLVASIALPVAIWFFRTPSPVPSDQVKPEGGDELNIPLVVLITLFFFLYVSAEASFSGWIYTYTTAMDLGDAQQAAYLTSAFWGSFTLGRLIGIPLATRLRPRTMIMVDLIGCLISITLLLIGSSNIILVVIATLGVGLSMASLFPAMLVLAERRMRLSGMVTRWFFVGAGLGGMFLPWLIGQLFVGIGPQVTMILIAADLFLVLVIALVVIRFPQRRRVVART